MRAGSVFIDSGVFIAFFDRSDRHHAAARALLGDPPRRWCTSIAVISETYGWFLHRHGEEAARAFRMMVASLPKVDLLALDIKHHAAVEVKLELHRGRKLTYVDASSLVFLKREKVSTVWGVDNDLAIEGATVVPGPYPN